MFARMIMILLLVSFLPCRALAEDINKEKLPKGTISGQVAVKDGPAAASGLVAFFNVDNGPLPRPGLVKRVPDHIASLSPEAMFVAEVRPGTYYIGVIFGRSSRQVGPPAAGEQTMVAHGADGRPKIFTVRAGETIDAGIISGRVPDAVESKGGSFTVKGKVRDRKGAPMSGAIVLAFRVNDKSGRPAYTLNGTGPDGSYELLLSTDSEYHIAVRTRYGGGQPAPGEFVGRYGEKEAIAVKGGDGDLVADVDIEVFLVPEPGESKSKFEKKPQEPPLEESLPEYFYNKKGAGAE